MNRRYSGKFLTALVLAFVAGATAPAFPMAQGDTHPDPPDGSQVGVTDTDGYKIE